MPQGLHIKRAMEDLKAYITSRPLEAIPLFRADVRARPDLPTDAANCELAQTVIRLVPELAEHPPRGRRGGRVRAAASPYFDCGMEVAGLIHS